MEKLNFDYEATNDEDFFGSLGRGRSNLNQLFGIETQHDNNNHTLKYQPPKQTPTYTEQTNSAQQIWSTQLAKVANAFKQGEAIGKVGVALLKNESNNCKLILYKTKLNVLTTLTLNKDGNASQVHRKGRYVQFYDDDKLYWCLLFDKEVDEYDFVIKLQEFHVNVQHESDETDKSDLKKTSISTSIKKLTLNNDDYKTSDPAGDCKKETQTKSSIMSRMAKMGQPLPKMATTTEYSDSSDTEMLTTPLAMTNKPSVLQRNKIQPKTQIVPSTSGTSATIAVNPIETQLVQMLVTETRTQNTEVRMNLNKLESKIEKVLDKIDTMNCAANTRTNKDDDILELEEKVVELKKENRKLKQMIGSRTERSNDNQVEKILKVYKNDLEILDIPVENDLEKLISNLLKQLISLTNNIDREKANAQAESKQLKAIEEKLIDEKNRYSKAVERATALEITVKSLQSVVEIKEIDNAELQHKLAEQMRLNVEQMQQQRLQTESTVKSIMNSLYSDMSTKLEDIDKMRRDDVLALIGKTIREETIKIVEDLKK